MCRFQNAVWYNIPVLKQREKEGHVSEIKQYLTICMALPTNVGHSILSEVYSQESCGAPLLSNLLPSFTFYPSGSGTMTFLCILFETTMLYSEMQSLQGLFYLVFIFSWTVASATNTSMLVSRCTVALRHFLYKDCFSLNCEKLLLVRGQNSFPQAELKRAHRVPRWPRLCECWAVEVLKKCQVSYGFKWWMFFLMSSERMRIKYLKNSRTRLMSVPMKCRFLCMVPLTSECYRDQ